jgi:3-isopropylmalate dehydrogenase
MMLQYSFDMPEESALVGKAVKDVLKDGFRTRDIHKEGATLVSTDEMGNHVVKKIREAMS